jgi:TPR repeat protein
MALSFLRRWLVPVPHKPAAVEAPRDPAPPEAAEAQFHLGLSFANAEGEAQNYPQAAQWYLKAAAQNHALAQFNLAVMYAQGQGVPRDEARSMVWLTRAAELGDAGAQYRLGIQRHLASRGVAAATATETRIEAFKWVRLSAAQGYRGADRACEFVTFEMTRDEVTEGGRRVAAFVPGETAEAQQNPANPCDPRKGC